ncbi:MAG: hypothetical protein SNJ72_01275 [Fimbriimonadales bacterium]
MKVKRRERTLIGILFAVILVAALALIRSQPWGRLDIRLLKPNTVDWIVAIQLRDPTHGDLVVLKPDGSVLRLTDDEDDDRSPDWAPDGKKIVFSSNRRDRVYQLWTIDPDGKNLSQLTLGGGAKLAPKYDPDGKLILHVAQGLVTEIDNKGVKASQLIPLPSQMTQVREQFDQIAFRYARRLNYNLIAAIQRVDDGEQLVIQDLDIGQTTFALPVIALADHIDVDWAPDRLLVATAAVHLLANPETGERVGGLFRVDLTEGLQNLGIQPLWVSPDSAEGAIEVAWSPDGSRIAFVMVKRQKNGAFQRKGLYVVPERGGVPTEIVAGEVYEPSWAPDGERLVFSMGRVGARQLHTVRVDGSELKALTQEGDYITPRWSPAR